MLSAEVLSAHHGAAASQRAVPFAITSIFKWEERYLREWLEYHLLMCAARGEPNRPSVCPAAVDPRPAPRVRAAACSTSTSSRTIARGGALPRGGCWLHMSRRVW
eukprot:5289053-Prymnesium_polylepis.1